MSFNGSPMTTVKGKCCICHKPVERLVTIHTKRHMKRITCGGWKCKQELSMLRHREKREGVRRELS